MLCGALMPLCYLFGEAIDRRLLRKGGKTAWESGRMAVGSGADRVCGMVNPGVRWAVTLVTAAALCFAFMKRTESWRKPGKGAGGGETNRGDQICGKEKALIQSRPNAGRDDLLAHARRQIVTFVTFISPAGKRRLWSWRKSAMNRHRVFFGNGSEGWINCGVSWNFAAREGKIV